MKLWHKYLKFPETIRKAPATTFSTFVVLHVSLSSSQELTAILPLPFLYFAVSSSSYKPTFPDAVLMQGVFNSYYL
jgi:hypothetical protein